MGLWPCGLLHLSGCSSSRLSLGSLALLSSSGRLLGKGSLSLQPHHGSSPAGGAGGGGGAGAGAGGAGAGGGGCAGMW